MSLNVSVLSELGLVWPHVEERDFSSFDVSSIYNPTQTSHTYLHSKSKSNCHSFFSFYFMGGLIHWLLHPEPLLLRLYGWWKTNLCVFYLFPLSRELDFHSPKCIVSNRLLPDSRRANIYTLSYLPQRVFFSRNIPCFSCRWNLLQTSRFFYVSLKGSVFKVSI